MASGLSAQSSNTRRSLDSESFNRRTSISSSFTSLMSLLEDEAMVPLPAPAHRSWPLPEPSSELTLANETEGLLMFPILGVGLEEADIASFEVDASSIRPRWWLSLGGWTAVVEDSGGWTSEDSCRLEAILALQISYNLTRNHSNFGFYTYFLEDWIDLFLAAYSYFPVTEVSSDWFVYFVSWLADR